LRLGPAVVTKLLMISFEAEGSSVPYLRVAAKVAETTAKTAERRMLTGGSGEDLDWRERRKRLLLALGDDGDRKEGK
jgi:hypothetical protein